jgi:hypothetical protein
MTPSGWREARAFNVTQSNDGVLRGLYCAEEVSTDVNSHPMSK